MGSETPEENYTFSFLGFNSDLYLVKFANCKKVFYRTVYTMRAGVPTEAAYKLGVDMVSSINSFQSLAYKNSEDIEGCLNVGADKFIAGEYLNYDDYKKILGTNAKAITNNDWGGAWLKTDRTSRNQRWKNAMEKILEKKWKGVLKPFGQVADFYLYCQWKAKNLEHEVKWGKGAAYLVEDLADGYEDGYVTTGATFFNDAERIGQSILTDLNLGILDLAIDRWSDLFKGTVLKGDAAYQWDKAFVQEEQVNVAYPIYTKYQGTRELLELSKITRKEGIFGKGSLVIARSIPNFLLIGADINKVEGRYGEYARVHIPLFMLYPYIHNANISIHTKGGVVVPIEISSCLSNGNSGTLITTKNRIIIDQFSGNRKEYDCTFAGQCIDANQQIELFANTALTKF